LLSFDLEKGIIMRLFIILALFFALAMPAFNACSSFSLKAQEEKEEDPDAWKREDYRGKEVESHLRYFQEKYEMQFDAPFEVVWNSILEAIQNTDCMIASSNSRQTDEGFYRGVIKSDFCVFSAGVDSTFHVLQKYSFDMPVIPSAKWESGRIQHKFIVKEQEDGSVDVLHTSEMSGWEGRVTAEVHFWKSSGMLEHYLQEDIKAIIASKLE
jgi:hypothetical protein